MLIRSLARLFACSIAYLLSYLLQSLCKRGLRPKVWWVALKRFLPKVPSLRLALRLRKNSSNESPLYLRLFGFMGAGFAGYAVCGWWICCEWLWYEIWIGQAGQAGQAGLAESSGPWITVLWATALWIAISWVIQPRIGVLWLAKLSIVGLATADAMIGKKGLRVWSCIR